MRKVLLTTAVMMGTFALASCETITEADSQINQAARLTDEQARKLAAAQRGEVMFENRPYYGEAVRVPLGETRGSPLPRSFEAAKGVTFNLASAQLSDIAGQISSKTQIPVKLRTKFQTTNWAEIEVRSGARVTMNHVGSLSKFLDLVASKTDTSWSYDGSAITIATMVNKTYQVPLPTGTSQFSSTVSGLTNVGGSTVSLSRSAELDPWSEIETRLAQVVAPPAEFILNKNAGTVTVLGQPSVQEAASSVVDDFKAIYGARIGLEIGIFFVDSDKLQEFEGGLETAGVNGSLSGLATALAGNGVATLSRGDATVSFRALSTNQAVVDFRQASSIAQSGVWTPTVIKNTQNYVSGTETSVTDGVTSTSIETGSIDSGLSIHALPRITNDGKIHLNLTLLQSSLNALDTFSSSNSTVQLPSLDERALQNDAILSAGETLVLAGYEQEYAVRGTQTNLGIFGGSNKGAVRKVRMIVLVRPSILPSVDRG